MGERDTAKHHCDHRKKKATLVVIITYVPIFALNLEVFLISLSLFIRIEHDQNAAYCQLNQGKIPLLLKRVEIIAKLFF